MKDPLLSAHVLAATPNPQQLVWLAAHQDYSNVPVYQSLCEAKKKRLTDFEQAESESYYGERLISMLLSGGKGHFGCFEHPQITFNCAYVPHSTVVQARTHRVGVTFDVQSFRYTSSSILSIESDTDLEKAFYFRPVGEYTDRQGKRYAYTEAQRDYDLSLASVAVREYRNKISDGYSEEHARDCLPCNYRQHMVVSFNARSLMHFLDLRAKADAQLEIQWLCELLFEKASVWMPQVFEWYGEKRWKKAKLAP